MSFNPLTERGIPLEKQLRNWSELNVEPYDKDAVHPFTRCRVILMNGIEVEAAMFSHQFETEEGQIFEAARSRFKEDELTELGGQMQYEKTRIFAIVA